MIVLDTNLLSELLRPHPDSQVLEWLAGQPQASLFTTTVTRGEILYGLRLLPHGQRRQQLYEAVQEIFIQNFAGRILGFDNDATTPYADIAASRRSSGKPISQFDAMIAAITHSRGACLATRNVKDFTNCGIEIINPWGVH